ncbi:MMPL family transporter [Geodermatophilus sp. YIM 151500]|uniref:MMPL family transporter n=1 Tax=Geodermatophilus sp. YIM 151500 TaxID=2984531 RepID=UPI0021E4D5F3|nr:MMPL family transporter [Geodermatophilus sp. YIM 151500]MCV2490370.1 MMPL family transporter [Geodermatophilus sp. YIM 151500]
MPRRSPLRSVVALPRGLLRGAARAFRALVVSGRWLVVAVWLGGAVFAVLNPVPGDSGGSGDLSSLLPPGSEAVEVQQRSLELFQVPVLSDTSVVVHDPGGLSVLTRADVTLRALAQTQAYLRGDIPRQRGEIIGAVPVPTSTSETAVTYLYISPYTSLANTAALGRQYATHFESLRGVDTYVTGVVPAQVQQAYHLEQRLRLFEIATLVLITVIVAITFRSVVAPLVVLFTATLGYFVATWVLGQLAAVYGFALPEQLQPLLAALLIGVVTDYCVLFFSGFRRQLGRGLDRREAARRTVLTEGPIVAVAGLTVAGGTAALLAANFELFRAFGPALALTVVVGVVVSVTLVPAVMAILGSRLFFSPGGRDVATPAGRGPSRATRWLARVVSRKAGAAVALLFSLALLVPAALPLLEMRIDVSFTSELPDDDPVLRGARVLDESGVRGVVAPTEVIVEGRDLFAQRPELEVLQGLLAALPGVAEVIGPAQNPFEDRYGIVFSRDGDAARFVVIFDSDPLGAPAIEDYQRLRSSLDGLLDAAGLEGATAAATGQTAIASELADLTRENLWLTLLAALVVELVILAVYLRALVAPLFLLASSALGVAASLGLTVVLFQGVLSNPGLIFFAPFTTAVLLLALGSDYNVFAVGSIWDEARRRPLSEAIAVAMPNTARAISAAGVILAATFAMVAIIPLGLFRQIAFTMAVGLLLDTFLIRPVLTPALLTLLGRTSSWPSRRIRVRRGPVSAEEQARLMAAPGGGAAFGRDAAAPDAGGEAPEGDRQVAAAGGQTR